jgi:DNA polymerase III delta prime subunit
MTDKTNIPWIEKYRPTHFDDIVLDPLNKQLFQNILKHQYFPNLLFYGPPGTGKTTTIINLIKSFQSMEQFGVVRSDTDLKFGNNRENVIHLNASDERGIDIIRVQINQFVKTKNLFETGLKFVILDEVDYMTKNAQQSLKSLLQTCRNNVRFCLICNYISKIDESLQNEFICVRFNQLPEREIHQFMQTIIERECLSLSDTHISTIQTLYNSDIRSMINFIQLHAHNSSYDDADGGNRDEIHIITSEIWETIYALCNSSSPRDVIAYIHGVSIQYNMDKRSLLNAYYDYVVRNKPNAITVEYLRKMKNIVHVYDDVPINLVLRYFAGDEPATHQ